MEEDPGKGLPHFFSQRTGSGCFRPAPQNNLRPNARRPAGRPAVRGDSPPVNNLFTVSSNFPLAFLGKVGYIVLALRDTEC